MAINPSLCKNHNWQFAAIYTSAGKWTATQNIVLFCTICAKIKRQKIKGEIGD